MKGLRLLLVEGNLINLQIASSRLKGEGAIVSMALNGEAALHLLQRDPDAFDLVLMDLRMPVHDDLTTAGRIRQELRSGVPIIAMTASHAPLQALLEAGILDVVPKPLDPRQVLQKLERLGLPKRRRNPALTGAAATSAVSHVPILPHIDGIDVAALFELINGQQALMVQLLHQLGAECHVVASRLETFSAAADQPALERTLHSLKGVTANVRAYKLQAGAEQLEAILRTKGLAALRDALPSFVGDIKYLQSAIAAALANPPGSE